MKTLGKMLSLLAITGALASPLAARIQDDVNGVYTPNNIATQNCIRYITDTIISTNKRFSSIRTNEFNKSLSYVESRIKDHEQFENLEDCTRLQWQDLLRRIAVLHMADIQTRATNTPLISTNQDCCECGSQTNSTRHRVEASLITNIQDEKITNHQQASNNLGLQTRATNTRQDQAEQRLETRVYDPSQFTSDNIRNRLNSEFNAEIPDFDNVTEYDVVSNISNGVVGFRHSFIDPVTGRVRDYVVKKIVQKYTNHPLVKQEMTVEQRLDDIKVTVKRDGFTARGMDRCIAHFTALSMLAPEKLQQYSGRITSTIDELSATYTPERIKQEANLTSEEAKKYIAYFEPMLKSMRDAVNNSQPRKQ